MSVRPVTYKRNYDDNEEYTDESDYEYEGNDSECSVYESNGSVNDSSASEESDMWENELNIFDDYLPSPDILSQFQQPDIIASNGMTIGFNLVIHKWECVCITLTIIDTLTDVCPLCDSCRPPWPEIVTEILEEMLYNDKISEVVSFLENECPKHIIADLLIYRQDGSTILDVAVIVEATEVIMILIKCLTIAPDKLANGLTLFHYSVIKDDIEMLKMLISDQDKFTTINTLFDKNITPLHIAAIMGNYELIEMLIEAGADPNILIIFSNKITISMTAVGLLLHTGRITIDKRSCEVLKIISKSLPIKICKLSTSKNIAVSSINVILRCNRTRMSNVLNISNKISISNELGMFECLKTKCHCSHKLYVRSRIINPFVIYYRIIIYWMFKGVIADDTVKLIAGMAVKLL